ncbi:MAG: hypothetical protein HKN12_09140, partial [Gemmatimonadetes bacterium]|nr:hypothetical protein [Gemmatimonadota bacterium]
MGILSVGLDLGSTNIKAAAWRADGTLGPVVSEMSPALTGEAPVREAD